MHDAFHVGFVLTAGFESRCLVDLDLLLGGISQSAVFSPRLMIIRASITKELIGKTAQASTEGLAEESIREITRGTLEAFGYTVLTASDGTEALALYADRKNDIAVVLTDMVMPVMDGPATIRALHRMNPQLRIIAASGLTANNKPGEGPLEGVTLFLSKPYTAEKLLHALAQTLRS